MALTISRAVGSMMAIAGPPLRIDGSVRNHPRFMASCNVNGSLSRHGQTRGTCKLSL